MNKPISASTARPTFTALTAALMLATLSGCFSGGGGGSSASPAPEPVPDPLRITTTEGDIQGIEIESMRVFRGIPYAQPPVGELRFASTVAAEPREAVLELSDAFGNMCPQTNITTRQVQGDEDCLFLNVYAPPRCQGSCRLIGFT